jgi:hypothetical protein
MDATRDYATDMRAVIDAETGDGPYVSRTVAVQIVEKLTATDVDLLSGWLHFQAEQLLWQAINDRDRSTRAHARATASRSVFRDASAAHDAGDSTSLRGFLDVPYVVEDGSRVRLADLMAADLRFVAESYDTTARKNAMNATFMRALAKKVSKGKVSDHFTNEAIADLWRSISGA